MRHASPSLCGAIHLCKHGRRMYHVFNLCYKQCLKRRQYSFNAVSRITDGIIKIWLVFVTTSHVTQLVCIVTVIKCLRVLILQKKQTLNTQTILENIHILNILTYKTIYS